MANRKRLFLLDAYALIFRGYYAFIKNPRINSKKLDTSAILGFTNSLFDVIKREKPDYLAVCFDKGRSVDRTQLYSAYKANRLETPEAIKIAVPYIEQILEAMKIPSIAKQGYEADDIIGTLAKKAEKQGFDIYMVTSDKDYAQLVSEHIFMYRPPRMGNQYEKWGVEEVKSKFEVDKPEQVIDFLAMMGDASDNIPGLPGVGEKTAKKFIASYGSLEGLFANIDELKGKMKQKVADNQRLGLLSKKLATIILNVPIDLNEDELACKQPDIEKVIKIFQDLEFRRLADNFKKTFFLSDNKSAINNESQQLDLFANLASTEQAVVENDKVEGFKNLQNTAHFYQLVNTPLSRKLLLKKLLMQSLVCFDTETTGLKALEVELIGIAFSWEASKGYYMLLPENQEETQQIVNEFIPFFENEFIEKVGHNLKYDIKVLSNYNIRVAGKLFDTMIAHYLINPDMRHSMNVLSETYLNYKPISITELIGKKGKNQLSMRGVEAKLQCEYAVEDADISLQLKEHFEKELKKVNAHKLFTEVEIPLVNVLSAMEIEGVNLNTEYLSLLSKDLTTDIQHLEQSIYQQAGESFNIASTKQLGIVLFEKLRLVNNPKKTKTGQYSTAEEVLSYLASEHKIIADILLFRQYKKLQSTYVDALPNEINSKTGRIHTVYAQAVTSTGRLSSNNPNLQNIPIRTQRGQEIRKAFIPKNKNHLLLAADYSQIELRIIAALSGEKNMMEAFKKGEDIHASTASRVFEVAIDRVSREQRSQAKTINFGIIYGVSAFGLSNQTTLSRKEAKVLIDAYYQSYPELRNYVAKQIDFAREYGYVETLLKRRRYLKDINSRNTVVKGAAERNAVNAPIQGSAADIIKLAMINIHRQLINKNYQSKMLLQVHDELVFDVCKNELESLTVIIKHEMENAFPLSIPLKVDIGVGNNWLEAH
ncbi:MAG: DNA polymerase I [Tenacibaculum sp.]